MVYNTSVWDDALVFLLFFPMHGDEFGRYGVKQDRSLLVFDP